MRPLNPFQRAINERDLAWAIEHLSHSRTLGQLLDPDPCPKGFCPNWYIWG